MTIFEWCDKNPDKELSFYWSGTGEEITVRSREFAPNPHVSYEFDDLNVEVIKEQIIRNRNVYVCIRTNDRHDIYEFTFRCTPYTYKRIINRHEIERFSPIALNLLIEQIFDDAMKELSDAFLGRDK